MNTAQQYCLRWNNHRSNLLRVFDELLQNEAFTDVTIVCDGGNQIKCHKMVLAACSPYFQDLFTGLPCKHPIVVLKDVKYIEIKAILEYMYRGEVNVAQNQLAALLKVAEALKVKGLVEENRSKDRKNEDQIMDEIPSSLSTSPNHLMQNMVHSSSNNNSPPHSTNSMYKNPYSNIYTKNHQSERSNLNLPIWAVPGLPLPPSAITPPSNNQTGPSPPITSNNYEPPTSDSGYHHRRKKFSSLMLNKDTPILRTVLGQGQADSSQPVSLVCHADTRDESSQDSYKKHMKNEPLEDAQSPYTDFQSINEEDVKPKMAIQSPSPHQSYNNEVRSSGIATYVPSQMLENKRYKQYTRDDIMSAIEAVRNGMSALQAARKYNVPSRTLYDKVKKLGITTSRPFKRGTNGSSACFPYMIGSSSRSIYHMSENDEPTNINNNTSSLLEASNFLQHALDNREGDAALTAMAVAAAAHAAASKHSNSSPPNHGHASSPSPSPTSLKYLHHSRMSPASSPTNNSNSDHHMSETNGGSSEHERDYDDDQVEDLSIGSRKQQENSGVIMPPMNQISTIMKNEEILKDDQRMSVEEKA